jgi:hypothetical protein
MSSISNYHAKINKVNLFLIGAMRAGSNTLYQFLSQHPEIYMSKIKEPEFFVSELYRIKSINNEIFDENVRKRIENKNKTGKFRTFDKYEQLFSKKTNEKYAGEASHYIHHPGTAGIIYNYNPDSRIVVSLRNPIDRIYSEYMLYLRDSRIKNSFNDFIKTGIAWNIEKGKWDISSDSRLSKGFYSKLLKPWFDIFGEEKIMVILFDELVQNPTKVCKELYAWLKIDKEFIPKKIHAQRSGKPRSVLAYRIFQQEYCLKNYLKKKLPREIRVQLHDYLNIFLLRRNNMDENSKLFLKEIYCDEINNLERMIDKDLNSWK